MRKLTATILGFLALCILPVTSFADDQVSVAEQLLESAFACPVAPVTFYEMDSPLTLLPRATFSRNGAGFHVTTDTRILFNDDSVLSFAGDPTAGRVGEGKPRETHSRRIDNANYSDLKQPEVREDNEGRYLAIACRSEQKCIRSEGSRDYGSQEDRRSVRMSDYAIFRFCDESALQNAKAAFDVLIAMPAAARPTQPQLAIRKVRSTVVGGYINLREGPGLDWTVIAQIPTGETISVDEAGCKPGSDGKTTFPFCPVAWNGRNGWASSSGFN